MAGSGAGWLSLDASWATSLEMASCTGADADADADAEYGVMIWFVHKHSCQFWSVQFANPIYNMFFFHQTFSFQFRGLPAVLQEALQCWQRRDLHCQLHSDGRHICQW